MHAKSASTIDKLDDFNNTPLIFAASKGNVEAVRKLLEEGANPRLKNKDGWSALHYAAANGHIAVMKLLIAKDPICIEIVGHEGRTPLHRACNYGRVDAAAVLLDHGADIEAYDNKYKTSLHAAVSRAGTDNEEIIRFLISRGAKLEAATELDWTVLHSAARYGEPDIIKLLIELGANTEAKNNYGETALTMIIREPKMDLGQKLPIIKALLESKASVKARDNLKRMPLHLAAAMGYSEVVKLLLKYGALTSEVDEKGKTPLHYASEYGHTHIISILKIEDKPAIAGAGAGASLWTRFRPDLAKGAEKTGTHEPSMAASRYKEADSRVYTAAPRMPQAVGMSCLPESDGLDEMIKKDNELAGFSRVDSPESTKAEMGATVKSVSECPYAEKIKSLESSIVFLLEKYQALEEKFAELAKEHRQLKAAVGISEEGHLHRGAASAFLPSDRKPALAETDLCPAPKR